MLIFSFFQRMREKVAKNKCLLGILLISVVIIVGCCVFFVNPEEAWWMPKCPFYVLTGLKCPSCGNTRAIHQLLHGNFIESFMFNPFIVIAFPLAAAIIWLYLKKPRGVDSKWIFRLCWVYVALYCLWWILRNVIGL